MDSTVQLFKSGTHNLLPNEDIPEDAASASVGFITQDGRIKLSPGRKLVGADGAVGKIYLEHIGYRNDGTQVHYRKTETKIQYLLSGVWTDIITGLTAGADYTAANYSSLAGSFTFFTGVDGIYKIHNANPGSYSSMYVKGTNDRGYSMINKSRMTMWNLQDSSKTALKQSYIDAQDGTVYTTVTGEVLGASGASVYTGTLAFKAGAATRTCFGLSVTGTTGAGVETFSDNKNGTLTSDKGGTGTINYTTGAYVLNFNAAVSAGNVAATYQWEDSNAKGVTDFRFSATRLPGEGNLITQDIGGDPIVTVQIGQDGAYYSLKQQSAYRLLISTDDKTFDNNPYYQNMGVPSLRSSVSTQKGIIFINTSNPDKPEMTILEKNPIGDNILPVVLFPQFKFSNYNFNDAAFNTYERFVVVFCRDISTQAVQNDTVLLCNISGGTVDAVRYAGRCSCMDASANFFVGSPIVQNTYQIFNGFDDDGYPITNSWVSKGDGYSSLHLRTAKWRFIGQILKKYRRIRIKGLIDPAQVVEVWESYDDAGFQQVGTIRGDASYVDYQNASAIGTNYIGQTQIGGDDVTNAYPYFAEIKTHVPKFRKRARKFIATGVGYFDIEFMSDWDIMLYENRMPKRYRQKQEVSLDGTQTDTNP